jgi:photosystem II stability/assembly factor-like uncharacterized protein
MKKYFLLIVIFSTFNFTARSQWIKLYEEQIFDVSFPSTSIGYMTYGKYLKKTYDGGETWTLLSPGIGNNFNITGVQFLNNEIGYAVQADTYIIVKTTDGGSTWTQITSDTGFMTATIHYPFQFINEDIAFRFLQATNKFQKTINGGSAWTDMPGLGNIKGIHFLNANTGFAISSISSTHTLLKTIDGGATWISRSIPSAEQLTSVCFIDANTGFVVGSRNASSTNIILKTTNGGLNWTEVIVDHPVSHIKFYNSNFGIAVGSSAASGDFMWRSTDAGSSWTMTGEFLSSSTGLRGISFLDANTVITVGGSTHLVVKSVDAGSTWQRVAANPLPPFSSSLYALSFLDQNTIFALNGISVSPSIVKTVDGGFNWTGISLPASVAYQNLFFSSATMGFVVGPTGVILKTVDGGSTWSTPVSGTTSMLTDVAFVGSTGFATGENGVIDKSIDDGATWNVIASGVSDALNAVHVFSGTTAVVVGNNGTILKTIDGTTFNQKTSGTSANLRHVYFPTSSVGYAVGNTGKILKTTDAGETWSSIISGTSTNFSAVYFVTETAGYACGNLAGEGMIFSTNDGGSTWVLQSLMNNHLTDVRDIYFPTPTRGIAIGGSRIRISLCTNPSIVSPPQNQTVTMGETAVLSTSVSGNGTINYQWKKDGANVGSNISTLTINNALLSDAGNYSVVITDGCGTTTSSSAVVTIFSQQPSAQPTQAVLTDATGTSASFSFTAPAEAPTGYLILRKNGSAVTEIPLDGINYSNGAVFGSSTVVTSATSTTFTDDALTAGNIYHYAIFAFNGSGTSINYLATSPATITSLASEPLNHITNITFSNIAATSLTVTFTAALGLPTGYVVVRKKDNAPTATPADGVVYAAGSTLGDAIVVSAGNTVSLSETGVLPGSQYFYVVFPYNGNGLSANYLTTASTNNIAIVTTRPATPNALDAINVLYGSFTARWDPVTGAEKYLLDVSELNDFSQFVTGYNAKETTALIESVSGLRINTKYYYRVRAANVSGESGNSNIVALQTQNAPVGTASLQVVSTHNNTNFPSDEQQQKVSVILSNGLGARSAKLFYKGVAGTDYQSIDAIALSQDEFEATITRQMLDDLGIEFYWDIKDIAFIAKSANIIIRKSYSGTASPEIPISLFGGTLQSYQIISIPLELEDNLIQSIFGSVLGEYDDTQWRIVRYQNGGNIDFPTINKIELGKSYWFNSRKDVEIKTGLGETASISQAKPFTLSLDVGWNQIATPFPFAIDWDDVLSFNNSPSGIGKYRVYVPGSSSFAESNVLQPFSGGFVFTDQAMNLSLPVSLKATAGGRIKIEETNSDISLEQWIVPITIRQGKVENSLSAIGMHPSAKISKDDFDAITLPRFIKHLEMNSYHDDYFAPRFSKDVVPNQNSYQWNVKIESSFNEGPITLDWSNSDLGNNESELLLIDRGAGVVINMKKEKTYTFGSSEVTHLSFFYSKIKNADYDGTTILAKPYPNPSAEDVSFDFFAAEEGDIVVDIKDLFGRSVSKNSVSLASGKLNTIKWQGTDPFGYSVPQGIYVYEIKQRDGKNTFRFSGRIIRK